MILCVGAAGSGKSTLLKVLQQHGQNCSESTDPDGAPPPLPPTILDEMPIPIPTVGTNIVTLTRCKKNKSGKAGPTETCMVREIGGVMAPIWSSFIEPGRTRGILYVVDASSPETIGAATVHFIELLGHSSVEAANVMLVFTKADLQTGRMLHEVKSLMRLDQIVSTASQTIKAHVFNAKKDKIINEIFDWCMKFPSPPMQKSDPSG